MLRILWQPVLHLNIDGSDFIPWQIQNERDNKDAPVSREALLKKMPFRIFQIVHVRALKIVRKACCFEGGKE